MADPNRIIRLLLAFGRAWAGALLPQAFLCVAIWLSPAALAQDGALRMGVGDLVEVSVFGREELTTSTYVSEDGSISLPLIGSVAVIGLSPAEAARAIENALRRGEYLNDPRVTIRLEEFRSQQVSVLGQVGAPGRFPIQGRTTVFDVLAEAGGITEDGDNLVTVIRPSDTGIERFSIDLDRLDSTDLAPSVFILQGGDSVFVSRARQFFIYGEVNEPDGYRLEPGMTLLEAISIGGGLTEKGSQSRVEIKRKLADGSYQTFSARLDDVIEPDDVIRVKERIF